MRGERVAAAAAVLLLFGAACRGDGDEGAARPTPTPSPTPDPKCPLTGLDVPPRVDVARPAIAVKIEDSPEARPQSGLDSADVVIEEIVEGGITRFMAIYHCGESKQAGPVRSARFDDPLIARPFTRIIAYSGSNSLVEAELRRQKVIALNEINGGDAFFRIPPGQILTHNLFAHTEKLREREFKRNTPPPRPIFTFGELGGRAKRARSVKLNFTTANTIEYKWQGNSWRRFEAGEPFFAATGDQIAVPNVLVQEVTVNPSSKLQDIVGNASPEIDLEGTGRAFLFRDGRVVRGMWTVKDEGDVPVFETRRGDVFVFAPGPIWIELLPSKEGGVKGTLSFR